MELKALILEVFTLAYRASERATAGDIDQAIASLVYLRNLLNKQPVLDAFKPADEEPDPGAFYR